MEPLPFPGRLGSWAHPRSGVEHKIDHVLLRGPVRDTGTHVVVDEEAYSSSWAAEDHRCIRAE
eukprot:2459119-Lingulodinium_polyedra.AAC.1